MGDYYQSIYKARFGRGDNYPDSSQASQQSTFNRFKIQSISQSNLNTDHQITGTYVPSSQSNSQRRLDVHPRDNRQSVINCEKSTPGQSGLVTVTEQEDEIIPPSQPLVPALKQWWTASSSSCDIVSVRQDGCQLGSSPNVTEFHGASSMPRSPDMDYSDSESNCSFYQEKLREENQISKYFSETNIGTRINQEKEDHAENEQFRIECNDKKAASFVENRHNESKNGILPIPEIATGKKKRKPVCSIAKKLMERKSAGYVWVIIVSGGEFSYKFR